MTASTRLKLVHLEDNARDRELVAATLAAARIACEIIPAGSEAEFQAAMLAPGIDLILCDYSLPSYSGPEALEATKKLHPEIPFIFVSGTMGEERAVESLQATSPLRAFLPSLVPFKRTITRLQIIQFYVDILALLLVDVLLPECRARILTLTEANPAAYLMLFAIFGVPAALIVLFTRFYRQTYSPRQKKN